MARTCTVGISSSHARSRARALSAVALLGALALPAAAQTTTTPPPPTPPATPPAHGSGLGEVSLFGEEEIQIQVATKTATPLSKVPGAVTVITAQQIRESAARTIPELLRLVAGVNVRWNPMVQTLDVRSFGQNPFTSRVLLLIDGVPYNDWNKGGFSEHPSFDFFVLQNIKRIEVVRGPGSALYGENAFWGVVNIVTLSGDDLRGGRGEIYAGDRDTASVGAIYGAPVGSDGSFLVSAKGLRSQLPLEFWFDQQDSKIEANDVFLKAGARGFQFSYYRHQDRIDGYDAQIGPGRFRSADPFKQVVQLAAAKYDWHSRDSKVTFGSDVSYATRDGMRCAGCHALPENPAFAKQADHGHQLIGDFRLGWKPVASHDLLFGVEGRDVDAGKHLDEFIDPATTPSKVEFSYTKLAAYLQDQVSLADDRVRIVAGARYDGKTDVFGDEVSPRLAFVFTPTDALVLRAGWSTAFRFPTFTEMYQASWFLNAQTPARAIPLTVFQPNPNLKPEQIRTYDAGAEYRFSPSLSGRVDLFRSQIDDFIVTAFPRPANGPTQVLFENHPGNATLTGGEVELRWNLSQKLSGFVNYGYQKDSRNGSGVDATGKPIEFVYSPENKVNLAAYIGPFAGFRGTVEASWKDSTEGPSFWNALMTGNPAAGTGTLDSYTLLNARLSYDLPWAIHGSSQPVRVSLIGKDLLDEAPAETLIPLDVHLPGREIFGSVDFGF